MRNCERAGPGTEIQDLARSPEQGPDLWLRWRARRDSNPQPHKSVASGRTVQTCPGVAVLWGDVPGLSSFVVSWPRSWQQSWQQSSHMAAMSARTDLPIQATHPSRHCLANLGRLQWAQAAGPHQDHLVIAAATGLMHPGHPSPPGAIALMPLPGEQMPGHAARQLDQRRRPWRLVPRHEPSMRNYVRFMCSSPAISTHLLAASRRGDPQARTRGLDRSRELGGEPVTHLRGPGPDSAPAARVGRCVGGAAREGPRRSPLRILRNAAATEEPKIGSSIDNDMAW